MNKEYVRFLRQQVTWISHTVNCGDENCCTWNEWECDTVYRGEEYPEHQIRIEEIGVEGVDWEWVEDV